MLMDLLDDFLFRFVGRVDMWRDEILQKKYKNLFQLYINQTDSLIHRFPLQVS